MRTEFPQMQGFSKRNLEHIRRFATLYANTEFAKQAVSQLPWGHIVRLMQMVKNSSERDWYAQQTLKNGWSRSVMEMRIESGLYARQALVVDFLAIQFPYLRVQPSTLLLHFDWLLFIVQ